jgi:hypothetical protein
MTSQTNRRKFIKSIGLISAGIGAGPLLLNAFAGNKAIPYPKTLAPAGDLFFKISLAQWSLHKTLFD